jgi:diguanylate cyclase (GGDEF)-like protein/PAS domain S-box-containing protein
VSQQIQEQESSAQRNAVQQDVAQRPSQAVATAVQPISQSKSAFKSSSAVELALVQLLYQFAPIGFLASLVALVILGAVLWQELSSLTMFIWFVVAAAITIAHYGLYRMFAGRFGVAVSELSRGLAPTFATHSATSADATGIEMKRLAEQHYPVWLRRFVIVQLAAAAAWGFLALYLLPNYNIANRLSVVTLLAVCVTGAVAYLAPHRSVFRWLCVIVLVPLAFKLGITGERTQVMLALALLGLAGALMFIHYRLHMGLRQALAMTLEREQNAEQLAGEQSRVKAANAALADEIVGRMRAEQSERDARERLSMHLERTPLGVIDLDSNGLVLQSNPAAEVLFGKVAHEIIGKSAVETLIAEHERGRFESFIQDVMRSRESMQAAFACPTPSGRLIYSEFNATPLITADNKVLGVAAMIQDVTERLNTERTIQYMALHDALTGLPNRRLLQDRLIQGIAQARRMQRFLALLSVDIDRFKLINDALGHEQGDQVLKEVARRLKAVVRDHDTVARDGGDEFIVMLTDLDEPEAARMIADKIGREISRPLQAGSRELHITISIGISHYPADATDAQQLLKHADAAMYNAKDAGRNTVRVFTSDLHELMKKRLDVEARLRKGIEKQEFVLRYQPQFSVVDGKLIGCEALLRWLDPELGEVYPDDFLHLAEELGLIVPLGNWVFDQVCKQQMDWLQQGVKNLRISMNLSPRQFLSRKLLDGLRDVLNDTGAIPEALELEVPESVLMRNIDQSIEVLDQVKALGLKITIDDFGLGYSSLNQLSRIPADSLKVDRSFMDNVPDDSVAAASAEAIIAMARRLKLRSITEGVETEQQLAFLKRAHCDAYQGFYSGKPMTPEEIFAIATRM